MDRLPTELLNIICRYLEAGEDRSNFRLVNSAWAYAGEPYVKRGVKTGYHRSHTRYAKKLVKSKFAKYVTNVTFDPSVPDCESSFDLWYEGRLVFFCHDSSKYEMSMTQTVEVQPEEAQFSDRTSRALHREVERRRNEIEASWPQEYFRNAWNGLQKFGNGDDGKQHMVKIVRRLARVVGHCPNLKGLVIGHYSHPSQSKPIPFGQMPHPYDFGTESSVDAALATTTWLSCLKYPMESFFGYKISHHVLDQEDNHSILTAGFANLKVLRLQLDYSQFSNPQESIESWESCVTAHSAHLGRVLASATDLRLLQLGAFSHTRLDVFSLGLDCLSKVPHYTMLYRVNLHGFRISQKTFVDFFERHKETLTEISVGCGLLRGEGIWDFAFDKIAGRLPRLRRFVVDGDLYGECNGAVSVEVPALNCGTGCSPSRHVFMKRLERYMISGQKGKERKQDRRCDCADYKDDFACYLGFADPFPDEL